MVLEKYAAMSKELVSMWHLGIPVTAFMQLDIETCDEQLFSLTADLNSNINVHQTMFAGSIYSLATLTGWGAVYTELRDKGIDNKNIVLAKGEIAYKAPIDHKPVAMVQRDQLSLDITLLEQNKKLRADLEVNVVCQNVIAAQFNGRFVVLPNKQVS